MAREFQVYAIGNAIVDLQLSVTEEELKRLKLAKSTMRLVEWEEQQEILQYLEGKTVATSSGGSAANSVIALAQLGGAGSLGCVVGDDERGDFYLEEMEVLGIRTSNEPIAGHATGTSVILITPDGERTMNTNLAATLLFGPEHVNTRLIAASEWVLIEGYLFATEQGREAIKATIKAAKNSKTKLALTLSDPFVPNAFRDDVTATVRAADLVFANISEASAYVQKTDEEEIFQALRQEVPQVAMTRGGEGVWIASQGQEYRREAFPVEIVDATGAGDMFAGAYLYGITHGYDIAKSASLGCFLAAEVVSQLGARLRGNMKTLLEAFSKIALAILLCLPSFASAENNDNHFPPSVEKVFQDELQNIEKTIKGGDKGRIHNALIHSLVERLSSKNEEERVEAGILLQRAAQKDDVQYLLKELKEKGADPQVQIAIISTFGELGDSGVLDALRFEFNQGKPEIQAAIVDALSRVGGEDSVPILANILASPIPPDVKIRAASVLGKIGGDRAQYALQSILASLTNDDPKALRIALQWAIAYSSGLNTPEQAESQPQAGRKQFLTFNDAMYHFYRPAAARDDTREAWLLVCVHGNDLDSDALFEQCQKIGKQLKIAVLVPFFDPINFPDFSKFSLSNKRSDLHLIELIEFLATDARIKDREFYMFGIAEGGDFALRFAFANPDRIARAAIQPVTYFDIDTNRLFPRGLKAPLLAPDLNFDLEDIIKMDLALIVDPLQMAGRPFKSFYDKLMDVGDEKQLVSRIRIRELSEKKKGLSGALELGKDFLFPKN